MAAYFRRLSKSTAGTVLMVLFLLAILASFALADVKSYISGGLGGQGALARVGDSSVSERELSAALQRRLSQERQRNPQADYSSLAGEFTGLLEAIIQGRAVSQFAADEGLHLSKRLIDAEIVKIPGTSGLNGQFSEDAYQRFLNQQQLTDGQVREMIGSSILSRLILAPAAANARTPVGVATPYASMLLEEREANVVIVPAERFMAGIGQPGDADLAAFYKRNAQRYMVPEQRVLSLAMIGPAQVAKVAATDAEIAAYYKANAATYGGKATRTLSQVVAQSEAAAKSAAAAARTSGKLGAGAVSLGEKTRAELSAIAGDRVAAAAFGARQGDVVGPVRSDLGWHVIKVESVKTSAGTPLSAVRDQIAERIGADKRKEALEDLVDKVQTAIDDGASLAEAARANGLPVQRTPAITAEGKSRANPGYAFPSDLRPALSGGFDLGEGDDPVVETLPGEAGYVLVAADDVIAAAPAPLASIRDRVAADWRADQARAKARTVAAAIAAKAAKGTDLKAAVAGANAGLPAPETIRRRRIELSAMGGNVPPALGMMFSLAQGRSRMIADPQGRGFVIVQVTRIKPGNASLQPGLISQMQTEFQQTAGNEYAEQMTRAIATAVGVKRNEEAIAEARKRIVGGGN